MFHFIFKFYFHFQNQQASWSSDNTINITEEQYIRNIEKNKS